MKDLISLSEIVAAWPSGDGEAEVCATADAHYDDATEAVSIGLRSFLRHVPARAKSFGVPPAWLPEPTCVAEHLERAEAADFAKDVFRSWVKKVRTAIPREFA